MSATVSVPGNMILVYPNQIVKNSEAMTLRSVDEDSIRFKNLVASILKPRINDLGQQVSDHGLLNPISIRSLPGEAGRYAITDGLHRLTAWRVAFGDSKAIPAFVLALTDSQVLEAQIEGNAHFKNTRPAEYGKQLVKILEYSPLLTVEDLAERLSVEPQTIKQWMSLTKLPENIQSAIDNGTMQAVAGYILAKFHSSNPKFKQAWQDAQNEWLHRYEQLKDQPQGVETFCREAAGALKVLKKKIKEGDTSETAPEDTIVPVLRKRGEIQIELNRVEEAFEDTEDFASVPDAAKKHFFQAGYLLALQWVNKVDPTTKAERIKEKVDQAATRKEASEEKKAGKSADTMARSQGLFGGVKL